MPLLLAKPYSRQTGGRMLLLSQARSSRHRKYTRCQEKPFGPAWKASIFKCTVQNLSNSSCHWTDMSR